MFSLLRKHCSVNICRSFSRGSIPLDTPQVSASRGNNEGLFLLAGLNSPTDFDSLSIEVANRIRQLRKYLISHSSIEENTSQTIQKTLLLYLDAISNEICKVVDAAELCRHVHQSTEYKSSAENVFRNLSGIINELNSDESVYAKLKDIQSAGFSNHLE